MPDLRTKSEKTRHRLLIAASRVFAKKGFQDATIAEICELAKTNIASVNYHFRDKDSLYLEAWRFAFTQELDISPDEQDLQDSPVEQQLAFWITRLVQRVADDNAYSIAIQYKEMARPTRLYTDILEKEINPQRLRLSSLLKLCLGQAASERQIQYCHDSIMGQCYQLFRLKHAHNRENMTEPVEIQAFAEHVVQFSLAGIQAIRSQTINSHT